MSESGQDLPKPRLPWNVYGYTLVAAFASFVYGYNTGIIAPAIIFIPRTIPLTAIDTSAIVSLILVGAMIGSFFSGLIADAFGRRRVLAWNNTLMLLAAMTAALGQHRYLLMISRFVLGLGVGVASVIPGLYITEVAPAHVRGKLGAINQLFGWTGIIVSYYIGYEVVICSAGNVCWRYMFASGSILCMFHWILAIAAIPETPRWLVSQQRGEEALMVLTRIYGDAHEAHIIQQYQILCDRREHREPMCFTAAELAEPKYRRPLVIAMALQLFQQASGNSIIIYYCTLVFHSLGYSPRDALFYNAIACIPQLVVLLVVVFLLDHVGRKPALFTSEWGVIIGLSMIGYAVSLDDVEDRFWNLIIGVVIHRSSFAIGLGPVPAVLTAEILPFPIRGRGLSLALTLNWFFNLIVTASFPVLMENIDNRLIYWGFAVIGFIGVMFVGFFVEETKGISLEAIEKRAIEANSSSGIPELEFTEVPSTATIGPKVTTRPPSPSSDLR